MTSTYPTWIYDGSPIDDPFGYGQRAVDFLRLLKHPKSKLPGKAFQLDPWQERVVRRIYGPRHADKRRIVSTVILLLPRGARKSSLAAALALLHCVGPERAPGGSALFAAADKKQASIGFREALSIIRADQRLVAATKVSDQVNATKEITFKKDGTRLETIAADGARAQGRSDHFSLVDELHIWSKRDLWDAIQTGLDKVDNSLLVIATTAGRGQDNIAWEKIEDARKVARGEIVDPSILPVLFEAPGDVDWRDEAEWHRYNPGLAHGYPSLDGFQRHRDRAERSVTERESLLQLKLNVWLDKSTSPFVDMAIYDKGADPIDEYALAGRPCWVACDMATTTDLAAVVAAFPGDDDQVNVLAHYFCPADNLRQRGERDGVPYPAWAEAGHITPTPGNVIDYRAVESHIRHLTEIYDVREIGFDPAYAAPVMLPLQDDGFPVITIRQGWVTQSPALNVLERAIIGEKLQHGGNPVLRWNFANIAIHTDSAGNRTMHKGKSTDRIDGASATWMAVSRAAAGDHGASIYANTTRRPAGIMFF
jgi:phage terminase large subunit-like protein